VMYVHATSFSASQPIVAMYRNVASRYPK